MADTSEIVWDAPLKPGAVALKGKVLATMPQHVDLHGLLHVGMIGVTVVYENGGSVLFPWRVIDWVEFDRTSS